MVTRGHIITINISSGGQPEGQGQEHGRVAASQAPL